MHLFSIAHDSLSDAVRSAEAATRAGEPLTIDQQLKIAEIQALLSISQELSVIHHQGINRRFGA